DALKNALRIEVGETTADRQFSLDVGRCFGACGLAPVIMIDDDVHQRVRAAQLPAILDQYRELDPSDGEPSETKGGAV
ncbi:MAG: NAD(P)H-dependent oxidoreductase subunit E, partial [Planctomycetota bacterium]|nr:NAD(P)H-dependent oxidoreductase subunit E [Planctomycetota bacterium]